MTTLHFEWDAKKSQTNKRKHGIGFEEAKTVFFDDYARLIDDPDHSQQENRFVLLGFSAQLRLLVVCHCCREVDGVIRIISARKASGNETALYRQR
jgi:uncharacterized DUF497 family protein